MRFLNICKKRDSRARKTSIHSRYVWKICIEEAEEKKILALTQFFFAPTMRRRDIKVKISNVNI